MTRNHANDDGAAGIFTYVLLFLLMGILFLTVGLATDKLTMIAASMYTGIGETEQGISTLNLMILVFRAEPIIFLVMIGINYWIAEMKVDSGMAETSTMILASVEAITMSFILMVFVFAGNYALSQVVVFVNAFPVPNPDLALFAAVQYIHPAFLGICFLILLGVIVQYCMVCVRSIDFSNYGGR